MKKALIAASIALITAVAGISASSARGDMMGTGGGDMMGGMMGGMMGTSRQ